MLFYFLISIVFIAELIIAIAVLLHLLKLDKIFVEYNSIVKDLNPEVREMLITCKKISEQFLNLTPILVNKVKSIFTDFLVSQLKNLLGGLTFILVKKEVEKHIQS